jgi:hypothetical protein
MQTLPWSFKTFSNKGNIIKNTKDRSPEKHYPVLNLVSDIISLPVIYADITKPDAVLLMWVCDP